MSRIKTYPRECPGCKQVFNHRQNWSRHINGDKKQNPCYWYQEWKKNQSIKINTENIRLPTSNSHFIESKPIFSSTNNTTLNFRNSLCQDSNDLLNEEDRTEVETLKLNVEFENKNETSVETLEDVRYDYLYVSAFKFTPQRKKI